MKNRRTMKLSLTAALCGLCLATPMFAGMQGNSHAFGKTLAGWNETYWRWALGVLAVPPDANGNPLVRPHVVLMPFPNAPGDGTPGHIDVTLNAGQAFILPLWNLLGTGYSDGTPPDALVDLSVFRTLQITFQIDGMTIINSGNVMQFYSEFFFNPAIPVDFGNINSVIWAQGIGLAYHPLSVGVHTFQLGVRNTEPAFGFFVEYHNTWTVTVQPGK